MAKDRRKLQHIHSSIEDRQPTPATLEVGEIAVNNADKKEFLSIKSSQNKVVRFSSDEQMITWMEKKEVMPYVGYVRGDAGPSATSGDSPTADSMGSYGISNNDLLNNTSEIVIKLNQVAAKNTNKYNRVNASKDRYNKDVNPTTDSGINDGAGFFIDMSRYAMRGSNPSFSSLTVTDKTDLSGNTTISDGDGTGTRTGNTFTINVTNKNENVSARTSTIGTDALTVTGNSTTKVSGNTAISTNGTTTITSTGNTSIVTNGENKRITINSSGTGGDVRIYANDVLTATANTIVVSGTTSISAKTPTTYISGTTLEVNETNINLSGATNISGNTVIGGTATIYGATTINNNLNVTGNTNITGTTNISGATKIDDNLVVTGTLNVSGATTINNNLNVTGNTNITGTTNISGATKIDDNLDVTSGLDVTGATNLNGNLCVTGTVTASQAIYSSDINLKENIEDVNVTELDMVGLIHTKSYNFKGETNKLYGVIAQEVQDVGLSELVYTKDDGHLAVDYTSLMMLKIASLEEICKRLLTMNLSLKEEIELLRDNK